MISKSIISLRYCVCVIIIITHTLSIPTKHVLAFSARFRKIEIMDDLPVKTNMEEYLTKLEKILHFVETHERYVDMNLAFGLFLVGVNLKTIFQIRRPRIAKSIQTRLDQVLNKNDMMMRYFRQMVEKHKGISELDSAARFISELFFEADNNWSPHLQTFNMNLLSKTKQFTKKELIAKFSKWSKYVDSVYDFDNYSPSPELSDKCVSSLKEFTVNPTVRWQQCEVSQSCIGLLYNGTDYGYAITHRLLFVLMARFSRGCTILSAGKDKEIIDNFCAKIYNEAEYHSHNNFELPDLTIEQITLCTLEGHVQFLRRSWMDELFEFQKEVGCFASSPEGKEQESNLDLYEGERPLWLLVNEDQDILGGACNTHTTGVAAAMLSAAMRYILEKLH